MPEVANPLMSWLARRTLRAELWERGCAGGGVSPEDVTGPEDFTEALKQLLAEKGWSNASAAARAGLVENSIGNWRKGTIPQEKQFQGLLDACELSRHEAAEWLKARNRAADVRRRRLALPVVPPPADHASPRPGPQHPRRVGLSAGLTAVATAALILAVVLWAVYFRDHPEGPAGANGSGATPPPVEPTLPGPGTARATNTSAAAEPVSAFDDSALVTASVVQEQEPTVGEWVWPDRKDLVAAELTGTLELGSSSDLAQWFTSKGAIPGFRRTDKVTLTSNADRELSVRNIEVQRDCAGRLPTGTLVSSPSAGDSVTGLHFDLDQPLSVAKMLGVPEENKPAVANFFAVEHIPLAPGKLKALAITTATRSRYCRYTLKLSIADGNRTVVETIDNNGKPFEVSGVNTDRLDQYGKVFLGGVASPLQPTNTGYKEVNPKTCVYSRPLEC